MGRGIKIDSVELERWVDQEQNRHLCKCKCGGFVKVRPQHWYKGIPEFISTHNLKVSKEKKYLYNVGDIIGRLTLKKPLVVSGRKAWLCKCVCGNEKTIVEYVLGRVQSCGCLQKEARKKPWTDEQKHRFSELRKQMFRDGLYTITIKRCLGRKQPQEEKDKRAASLIGKTRTDEQKHNISSGISRHYENPDNRERQRQKALLAWQNPEIAAKQVAAVLAATENRPNGLEKWMLSILEELYPNEWRYVGDGKLILGKKCPDFVHKTKNLLIETFGIHWHKSEDEQERSEYFRKMGFDTLIVWEKTPREEVKIMVKEYVITSIFQCRNK